MTHISDLEYYIYVASSQIEYISITPNYHSDIMQIMNQLRSSPVISYNTSIVQSQKLEPDYNMIWSKIFWRLYYNSV
jgi:hypothetical protein